MNHVGAIPSARRTTAASICCVAPHGVPHVIRCRLSVLLWMCIALAGAACGGDDAPRVVLGTTHTLEDSGVLNVLTQAYDRDRDRTHRLSVVVAGSGEILAMAARGDVDVVLSHAPDAEAALVEAGDAVSRQPVMQGDFIIAGPPTDPAGAAAAESAAEALGSIAAAGQPFVSRGDDSGTHQRELALWRKAGVAPAWSGYMEAGGGMADALRLASQRGAYIVSDLATYEVLRHELSLIIVREGGDDLINEYSVLLTTHGEQMAAARELADWLTGETARGLIDGFRGPAGERRLFRAQVNR